MIAKAVPRAEANSMMLPPAPASIRHSKTDQEGVGVVRYLAPGTMREVQAGLAVAKVVTGFVFHSSARPARSAARSTRATWHVSSSRWRSRSGSRLRKPLASLGTAAGLASRRIW